MVGRAPENLIKLKPGLHLEKKFVSKAVETNWFETQIGSKLKPQIIPSELSLEL